MISNQKIVIIFTAILVSLAPIIYLWRDELKTWWTNNLNNKDCSFEINKAIENQKKTKEKEVEEKIEEEVLAASRQRYDYSSHSEKRWDGAIGGYLTKEEAYPECKVR